MRTDSHEISCRICYFRKSSNICNCRLLQIIGGALWVNEFLWIPKSYGQAHLYFNKILNKIHKCCITKKTVSFICANFRIADHSFSHLTIHHECPCTIEKSHPQDRNLTRDSASLVPQKFRPLGWDISIIHWHSSWIVGHSWWFVINLPMLSYPGRQVTSSCDIASYYIPITDTTLELSVFWPSGTESRINELRFSESISLSFKTRLTSVTCFCGDVT